MESFHSAAVVVDGSLVKFDSKMIREDQSSEGLLPDAVPERPEGDDSKESIDSINNFDSILSRLGSFGLHQWLLTLIIQAGYLGVTGCMIGTAYSLRVPKNCSNPNSTFYTLLDQLGYPCEDQTYWSVFLTTTVMVAGVLGALLNGQAADLWGRKRTTVSNIFALIASCVLLSFSTHIAMAAVAFALCGFFGGGFMTVNITLLLEHVGPAHRLLSVCLNGWPAGLLTMALLGYVTQHWRYFYIATAVALLPCALGLLWVPESPRWLTQQHRFDDALAVLRRIARLNRTRVSPRLDLRRFVVQSPVSQSDSQPAPTRRYTYLDLFRNRRIATYVLAMFYSWLASSIISFAIYFQLGSLSGNIFLNHALTGLLKGTTGFIPFFIGHRVGRKPIFVTSVIVACTSCWSVVIIYFASGGDTTSVVYTVFTVFGASAIDPIWKINHLYSAELFPTVVRNMARGVCNFGSRLGSVIGPNVAKVLSRYHFAAPFVTYGLLSLVHLLVCIFVLPETKDKSMPDSLDETPTNSTTDDMTPVNEVGSSIVVS